ncbi:MAG: hypothetical protein NVS2B16_25920 [Chloroflexota bacterium]
MKCGLTLHERHPARPHDESLCAGSPLARRAAPNIRIILMAAAEAEAGHVDDSGVILEIVTDSPGGYTAGEPPRAT